MRLAIVAAAVTGVVIDWVEAGFLASMAYFTIQSNVLVAAYYLYRLSGRRTSARLKGAVTLVITVTGLIYNTVLTHFGNPFAALAEGTPKDVANFLLHVVVPVLALADWLLFDRDLRPRWSDALLWLLYPLAYGIFAVTRGLLLDPATPKRYPYPFLDLDVLGWGGLITNMITYGIGFYLLGLALIALRRLGTRDAVAT
ncbi:Pr6Pr family membrane protein [Nonomuraea soli]